MQYSAVIGIGVVIRVLLIFWLKMVEIFHKKSGSYPVDKEIKINSLDV